MGEVLALPGRARRARRPRARRGHRSAVTRCETPVRTGVEDARQHRGARPARSARFGKARVAMPGGCQIGARKIDMHLVGLEALGVHFDVDHGFLEATHAQRAARRAASTLEFPSVGATENLLMAAVTAEGQHARRKRRARAGDRRSWRTCSYAMGARVSGRRHVRSSRWRACRSRQLHPCEHTTVGDRIEAGTFLAGGALMGGPVTVRGIDPCVPAHGPHEAVRPWAATCRRGR